MTSLQEPEPRLASEGKPMLRFHIRESIEDRSDVHRFVLIRRTVKNMGYFSKIYGEDLPHRAKTVYMYLKDRSDQNGQCYPAIATIAKELHLSRRTVERAISDLIRVGLLKKEQRWRENGGRAVCFIR